jgi:lipoprotein NlpI
MLRPRSKRSDVNWALALLAIQLLLAPFSIEADELGALDRAIETSPDIPSLYQERGVLRFFAGRFEEAIDDFDKVIELIPSQEAYHWQRGIAHYYAGRYADGVAQFELHQTVNSQDVENAVWHFLCKAKVDGLEEARNNLIPIRRDTRVPMAQVWDLFAGEGTVEDVLQAANRIGPSGQASRQSQCYAHLYLGLYFEISDDGQAAAKHMKLAATTYSMNNYMGEVAVVHARVLGIETE